MKNNKEDFAGGEGQLYRVMEFNGDYWIQKRLVTTKGALWWKKIHLEWKIIDVNGMCCVYVDFGHGCSINTYKIKMPPFKTLEDAKKQIKKLEIGVIIHYL